MGRITGSCFNCNGKRHLAHRRFQIAGDIHRQCFERRNVKRVNAFTRVGLGKLDKAWQKSCESFAAARRRNQQGAFAA